jgi:hypothetical protein
MDRARDRFARGHERASRQGAPVALSARSRRRTCPLLGVKRTSPAQDTDANVLTDIEHEIELASETVADVRYPHQQFALKQAITQVRWLVGEIELRGEQAAARRLNLDVIVPCAAGIELRHDGSETRRRARW